MKEKFRRYCPPMKLYLNRSDRLEGKDGFYDGKPISSRIVRLPEVREVKVAQK